MLGRFIRTARLPFEVCLAVYRLPNTVREFYATVDELLEAIERGELWPED